MGSGSWMYRRRKKGAVPFHYPDTPRTATFVKSVGVVEKGVNVGINMFLHSSSQWCVWLLSTRDHFHVVREGPPQPAYISATLVPVACCILGATRGQRRGAPDQKPSRLGPDVKTAIRGP